MDCDTKAQRQQVCGVGLLLYAVPNLNFGFTESSLSIEVIHPSRLRPHQQSRHRPLGNLRRGRYRRYHSGNKPSVRTHRIPPVRTGLRN
mgnify:CR=1 FL=1